MCDPLTIAGIALTAGATVANSAAANRIANARDEVLLAERLRQRGLDQEAFAINEGTQNEFVDFVPQQDAVAADLGDFLGARVGPDANTMAATVMPSSQSGVVNAERNKQLDQAQGFVDQQAQSLGALRAFGDLLGDKSRIQAQDAGLVGQIGGFKRGSSNIVPLELDEASKAGDNMKLLADILGGLGTVATGVGTAGGSKALSSLFGGGQKALNLGATGIGSAARLA